MIIVSLCILQTSTNKFLLFHICPTGILTVVQSTCFLSNYVLLFLGKHKPSVSPKLNEIIAKQKSQEVKDEANDTSLEHKEIAPTHSQQNINTKQKTVGASGNDEHHSNSKEEHLGFQDQRTENVSTNPIISAAKPSQPASPPNSYPTSQLRKHPTPDSVSCERTTPNILIHNKSQTLAKDQGW